jgi:hypothetical protein
MNSFKKIALGMVAAITLGTLVATPASAATTTLTVGGSSPATAGTTAATAIALPVPADNSVDSADALKIALTGLDTGTVVSASVTNGKIVTALATSVAPVTASAGSTSASVSTGTGTTADFYVFTTTTAAGSVAVTIGGNVTTYYFAGTAGALNTIALEAATSGAAGTTYTATVRGYDVFGNAKGNASVSLQYITPSASTTYSLTTDTATATLGSKTQDVTLPASGSVTLVATATVATAVTGLTAPLGVIVKTATVRDLASELAAVQSQLAIANAQLAAEKAGRANDSATAASALAAANAATAKANADAATAKIAATVAADLAKATYIAEYNALATKWNKAHPKAKVALKK